MNEPSVGNTVGMVGTVANCQPEEQLLFPDSILSSLPGEDSSSIHSTNIY